MNEESAMLLCDFYKISHREQYPDGTEYVYAIWIPRASRMKGVNRVAAVGFQPFIKKYLISFFQKNFFGRDKDVVVAEYSRIIKHALGVSQPPTKHIEDLHDLGYLPLEIKAVAEGTLIPLRVPMLTIQNTNPKFFWLTNYIETLMSCEMWQIMTSATIANEYRNLLNGYAMDTVGNCDFVPFQGHDFSMRGMPCLESAKLSGTGHAFSFAGSDTIPVISFTEKFYNANVEKELIIASVNATEHSVMCAAGQDELTSYKRFITKLYPTGIISIVSDTWDLWKVLTEVIAPLKDAILARDGGPDSIDKVVIRPDSGDPVKIICGTVKVQTLSDQEQLKILVSKHQKDAEINIIPENVYAKVGNQTYRITYKDIEKLDEIVALPVELSPEQKGVVEVLWDIFGGTVSEQGYKVLDSHIGSIYGDAITLARCSQICEKLKQKGFASTNVVFGIGSYTYQYNTRDTFGFALKSTLCVINGDEKLIYKDPKTDSGIKKSPKGKVLVFMEDGKITYSDEHYLNDDRPDNLLVPIFRDGKLLVDHNFADIRARLANQ